jgi:RNA-directed DNA polymerase
MSSLKWNSVEWPLVEQRVFRYQQRIYRASQNGNQKLVNYLQSRVLNSIDSKLLAVRQVTTENKGRKTPGVDNKLYNTPQDKIKLVENLKLDGKTNLIKRVEIPKPGTDQTRPLGIPTIEDRAKQALCRLALEPEWEARFESDSYGFRPGRNCHDAIEAAFGALSNKRKTPEYRKMVLKVDIEKCFDRINHKLLMSKLDSHPIIKTQIYAWLKAGILTGSSFQKVDVESIVQNEMGTPQGGIISPLLANIALHGLINRLEEWIITIPAKNNRTAAKRASLTVIRYADDILVIHKDKSVIEQSKIEVEKWLWEHCNLKLNQEKTKILDSSQGLDFLGFSLVTIQRNGIDRMKIYPSRESQKRVLLKIREIIQRNKAASSYQLISKLRPIIIGWGNYFKYSECKDIFSKLSHYIFQKLRAWAFRIDKRHGRKLVKEKYFPSGKTYYFDGNKYQNNWILYGKEKDKNGILKESFLPQLSWIQSKKWVKVKGSKSPFDGDHIYWAVRMANYRRLPTRVTKLLKRQNGICSYCQTRFSFNSVMEVDHITPKALGGKDIYANLQVIHKHCHIQKTRVDRMNIQNAKIRQ